MPDSNPRDIIKRYMLLERELYTEIFSGAY